MTDHHTQKNSPADPEMILADGAKWMREAAGIAKRYFRHPHAIEYKGDDSPVTIADRQIEQELKKAIIEKYPDDGILGEESGIDESISGNLWVIDPIDGTRSFISGNPLFGMLLAYLAQGEVRAGLILMPMLDELYCGGIEYPATCNGMPIRVSGRSNIDEAIVYINEGEKLMREQPGILSRLLGVGKTRRFAYDCYPHALLSAGHVDCVIDYDLKPYDFLPLCAVVKAAGGEMTDWQGNPPGLSSGGAIISSASPRLHERFLKLLNS